MHLTNIFELASLCDNVPIDVCTEPLLRKKSRTCNEFVFVHSDNWHTQNAGLSSMCVSSDCSKPVVWTPVSDRGLQNSPSLRSKRCGRGECDLVLGVCGDAPHDVSVSGRTEAGQVPACMVPHRVNDLPQDTTRSSTAAA